MATSGISAEDINKLVTQSLAANKKTLDSIKTRRAQYEQQKEAWSQIRTAADKLEGALDALKDPAKLYNPLATTTDSSVAVAQAGSNAGQNAFQLSNIVLAKAAEKQSAVALGLSAGVKASYQSTSALATAQVNKKLNGSEGALNLAGAVASGTFTINEKTITVNAATDTVMTVIGKINGLKAGFTAAWDDTAKVMRITNDDVGDETLEFGADTSGFLTAMRINTTAPSTTGVDADKNRELANVAAFSGVSNGYFTINGTTFSVNKSTDSLQDLINDINDSQADVTAYYNDKTGKVVLSAKETGKNVTFSNDTSNFLTTVFGNTNTAAFTQGSVDVNGVTTAIDGNTFTMADVTFSLMKDSVTGASVSVGRDINTAKQTVRDFVSAYNELSDLITTQTGSSGVIGADRTLANIKNSLRSYVNSEVSNPGQYTMLRDIGITYSKGRLTLDEGDLSEAIRTAPTDVGQLFGYDSNGDGDRDDGGLSNKINFGMLNDLTSNTKGDIYNRKKTITKKISQADTDYARYEKIMATKEKTLRAKYEQFAEQVNVMNGQYSTFSAQISSLNQLTYSLYGNGGGFV